MNARRPGARLSLGALSLATMLLIGACGSSDPTPAATTAPTSTTDGSTTSSTAAGPTTTASGAAAGTVVEIAVVGSRVAGGVKRTDVDLGDRVTIRVTSDVAEELHVHGYDLARDLTPGVPVEVSFTADIPGVFEVELEQTGLKVAELEVA